ncbi:efflux RND transporter periplasmic adaptor subunit [Nannocystis exedens]|uniref:efflux RND transporter periplasmic adaptor subunit n=1 Tax=Nannocystis exedens TaxID=54 RepID=UPI000BBA0460|nr:HlyD family efflux transporter periplasmic adaptor subunit [Nannocystis exedens]
MDIPIQRSRLARYRGWIVAAALVGVSLALTTVALGSLSVEPPAVAQAGLWIGAVERGEMLLAVQGNGRLVPEHIQWITALSAARVEKIHVRPGAAVEADTVVLELGNPDLELQALEGERQVVAARAALAELRATLRNERLTQKSTVATLKIDHASARRRADANAQLGGGGYLSDDDQRTARAQLEALEVRVGIEGERLAALEENLQRRLSAQEAQIASLETIARTRRAQVEALKVRAGVAGVLQELPLEPGQWVNPGGLLAKVARPDRLKARLQIPETLAKDVALGQPARIDTRNGVVDGVVERIDPAASGGTVTVDVALTGALPKGARPDLHVVGTVELDRLPDVLHVRRPAYAQPDATLGVFRVDADERYATRVNVEFGRASATTIEVLAGLAEGDRVVLSDMSTHDARDRLKLE